MEVIITAHDKNEKEILITVPWSSIREDYDSILKRYSKLSVRGFRPGKSPAGLVESCFAPQIKNDLMAAVSTRLCRKALKEAKLEAGSPVGISDAVFRKNENLRFKASFIEMPVFELPDYSRLNLTSENKQGKLDEISQKLLNNSEIDIHPAMIDDELKYSEDCNRDDAENRVKLMLILKKIASRDHIEIDERDIEDRICDVAADSGITPEYLRQFLAENNGLSRFSDSLLAEAVLDYIIEIQD